MDNLSLSTGGSIALASGALAAGTTAGTIKTTVAIPFIVDGAFATAKAITDNIAITYVGPTVYANGSIAAGNGGFTGQTGGSTRLYGLYLNAAGTVTIEPGPIVNTADLAAGTAALHYPANKRANACFGMLRVAVTASTTFVPGVTALAATGVTSTFINLATIPGEPLLA